MEWLLGDHWPGVYATTRKWAPAKCIVMITTNTPILALQEFHTMAVVPCLSTGMYGLEPRSIYWEWVTFQSVIIYPSSNFSSTWVLRKISATHLSLWSSKRTDLLVRPVTNLTWNRIYFIYMIKSQISNIIPTILTWLSLAGFITGTTTTEKRDRLLKWTCWTTP